MWLKLGGRSASAETADTFVSFEGLQLKKTWYIY